jgi:exopolysaccharide biosynthesis protein
LRTGRLVVVLLLCLGPPLSRTLWSGQRVTQPFTGVTYFERVETSPRPLRMHVAQIDLDAPGLRFKLSAPAGSREVVRQTTLEYVKEQRAQLAINAHFFLPFPSTDTDVWVIGLAASEGRVYSTFETPAQSYAIVANAPALNLDAGNRASIVTRDRANSGALWNTVSGSAQIVTDGRVTVPAYRDAAHPDALLEPGGPSGYSNEKSWCAVLTARTAIGLSRDTRTLTLFTVDARGGSEGMRLDEVGTLLTRDYGVWNALNLDGGGSTTMVMEDPQTRIPAIVNTSSDNPAGRSVGSSLAVFARPQR